MPRATDPKFNLLASKPDDLDRYWLFDIDANEQKVQQYGVLKSFFVKTDEPSDITAILEFQSTITKPNAILKFGSAGEFHIYSDGTDLFVKGTNAAGKLRFYANSAEMLTLNPVNDSIATHGNAFNYDGAAGKGLIFAVTTNRAKFTERLTTENLLVAEGGIQMLLKNISYTGAVGTGFEFNVSNDATCKQILNCDDNLNVTGQINANKAGEWSLACDGKSLFTDNMKVGANWIGFSGGNSGMHFDSSDGTDFSGPMDVSGRIYCFSYIFADSYIHSDTYINAANLFKCGASSGITYNGPISTINIKGGIVIGYT